MLNNHHTETQLKQRFLLFWQSRIHQAPIEQEKIDVVWRFVSQHYNTDKRHYHGLNHIYHCLDSMDHALDYIDDPDAMLMAIFFHDVVCDPQIKGNEQKSADLFQLIHQDTLSDDFIQRVYTLILATTHSFKPETNDEKIICDIDLSSFALPWRLFLKDSDAVRVESLHLSDDMYYEKKCKFLKYLLNRPKIYYSHLFFNRCEQKARKNITRFIRSIQKQGHGCAFN